MSVQTHDYQSLVHIASERLEDTSYYPGVDVMPRRMAGAVLDYLRCSDPSIPLDSRNEQQNRSLVRDNNISGGVFAIGYFGAHGREQDDRCIPWITSSKQLAGYSDFSMMTHGTPLGEFNKEAGDSFYPTNNQPGFVSAFAFSRLDADPLLLFEWSASMPPTHVKMIAKLAMDLPMADVRLMVEWKNIKLHKQK
jgi:hypothetical protein